MTTVYLIRHAQPDLSYHDDMTRPLSPKGLEDSKLVTSFLAHKGISAIYSSPYLRAVQTLEDFSLHTGIPIVTMDDFRERKVALGWIEDFDGFVRAQWGDFDYHLFAGESLRHVQQRTVAALETVLQAHPQQKIVVGSHGTAISTILNHYRPSFGLQDFLHIQSLMPWVVKLLFDGLECRKIETIDLFAR